VSFSARTVVASVVLTFALLLGVHGAAGGAAPRCFGEPATIVGTDGSDDITGTPQADVIVLGEGHDSVRARGGADLICGDDGDDFIEGNVGQDRADGGNGGDGIFGGRGADLLVGGDGIDGLAAGRGPDISKGKKGSDFLADGDGDDRLVGGPGSEILNGADGDDIIIGGPGNFDLVSFLLAPGPVVVDLALTTPQPTGQGLDRITGVEGAEGSEFDDDLFGNDLDTPFGNGLFGLGGDDDLDGRQRVDFLFGEGGDDNLLGSGGRDDLTGGEQDEDGAGDFGSGGTGDDACRELEADDGTCETLETGMGLWRGSVARWGAVTGPASAAARG
jgi:Ca2+-binding RTX toxin-like protein